MVFGKPLYWRETHKQPRFLIFDGRLVILALFVIMHVRIWTVALFLVVILSLFAFERRGISADSILRYLRSSLVGRVRTARGFHSERRAVDFGFETPAMVRAFEERLAAEEKSRKASKEKSRQGTRKAAA